MSGEGLQNVPSRPGCPRQVALSTATAANTWAFHSSIFFFDKWTPHDRQAKRCFVCLKPPITNKLLLYC